MRKPIEFWSAERAAEHVLDALVIFFAVLLFVVVFVATGDARDYRITYRITYSFPAERINIIYDWSNQWSQEGDHATEK